MQNVLGCKTQKKKISSLVCYFLNEIIQNFLSFKTKKSSLVCYCLHAEFVNIHVDMCMFDDQHDSWIKHELYIYCMLFLLCM